MTDSFSGQEGHPAPMTDAGIAWDIRRDLIRGAFRNPSRWFRPSARTPMPDVYRALLRRRDALTFEFFPRRSTLPLASLSPVPPRTFGRSTPPQSAAGQTQTVSGNPVHHPGCPRSAIVLGVRASMKPNRITSHCLIAVASFVFVLALNSTLAGCAYRLSISDGADAARERSSFLRPGPCLDIGL